VIAGEKILIVEDEKLIRMTLRERLVRELRNVIERIMILENKPGLDVIDLPEEIVQQTDNDAGHGNGVAGWIEIPEGGISLREVERQLVRQALARTDGNQSRAARLLHISRDALRYKMKKFDLL